jgi:hypothetical protein
MSILEHKRNVHSQNGEDGVIEYIVNKMGIDKGLFVEFGAWDGIYCSNTYRLFEKGWSGVYIEADNTKYDTLYKNFKGFEDRVECLNRMVGFSETNNLDKILDETMFRDMDFDFISIDVDGLDYFILERMQKYLPKVICIEVNAGHSPVYDRVIPIVNARHNVGQSIKVMENFGVKHGYFSLCYTGNLFMVKNEYKHLFEEYVRSLENMYMEFMEHLESTNKGGVMHLYNTFIKQSQYNGFAFDNPFLKSFCERNKNKYGL